MGKGEARHLHQNDHEPKHRKKPFNAIAQSEHFLLKAEDVQIKNVDRDEVGTSRGDPASRGGTRNTSPSRVFDISCRSDKIAKSMVVALLKASRVNHDSIIATVAHAANPTVQRQSNSAAFESRAATREEGENSRRKVQNVVADSTPSHHTASAPDPAKMAGPYSRGILPRFPNVHDPIDDDLQFQRRPGHESQPQLP